MTLGLLKACSKGLVLKVMFIQYSVGERYTEQGGHGEDVMRKTVRFPLLMLGKNAGLVSWLDHYQPNVSALKAVQLYGYEDHCDNSAGGRVLVHFSPFISWTEMTSVLNILETQLRIITLRV